MTLHPKKLPELKNEQALASDPRAHAALSASAGTGKTQVLTARVLRLLLKGARPESILCLTFTKAAAAEMANRIGTRLASWVRLGEADLGGELRNLGEPDDEQSRKRARQLFAKVLDCPGGLRIQTIHSFAQSLLAAFPAEAGIVPGFRPIEGRAEQELVRRTLAELMAASELDGNQALIGDVQRLSLRLGEAGAVDYLQACARNAGAMDRLGPADLIEPMIARFLDLPEQVDEYLAAQCADDGFDCDLLHAIAQANRVWGKSSGMKIIEKIEQWLALEPGARADRLPDLALIVFTGDGEARKAYAGQVKADSDYEHHCALLGQKISKLLAVLRGSRFATEISGGLRSGQAFARAYARAKRASGVADFNDLIEWTRQLLAKPGMGDWVRYKLDRQVDHVLVDEAQDTNGAQWEIIERLVEEYFSGSPEHERRPRTLFMVGDFKQAIYGFQGTDPERFREARELFKRRAEDLNHDQFVTPFHDLSIAASFRSSQPVLDVVDSVIGTIGHEALALSEPAPRHRAHHRERAGSVELWEPFAVSAAADDNDDGEERWVSLRDRQYAEALAERIRMIIADGPVLASTGKALTPGDILVLVRSRGELASLIVARLFAAGVPVAGVDRLHLHEPLAVQDLLAAVKFAVQPNDDLSLASLLVSPLIGWDQEQLRALALGRDTSLWHALQRDRGNNEKSAAAHDELAEILRIADFVPPSRFLETILSGRMDGRRRLYSRLGLAARDAINELVNSAIDFERTETGSLDRFLSWFSKGTVDVQRDPGQAGNEVRVMTVHGAKGLEAPVVIIADATADPARLGRSAVSVDIAIDRQLTAPLLRPKKEERCPPFDEIIAAEEKRDLQEHFRLLYVALTRAADRLIISGVRPKERSDQSDPRPSNCWHRIVEDALINIEAPPGDGHVKLHYGAQAAPGAVDYGPLDRAQRIPPPPWALCPPPPEARPPKPLAPSAISVDDETASRPSDAMRAAARRGTLIHQLLERLPALAPDEWDRVADRWLEHSAGVTDAAAREDIRSQVTRLLADPRFAELFKSKSLAEAPLAATLPDGRVIAGTVDRLVIGDERIRILDFKTGRVPASERHIPNSHRAQMNAYVEALKVIFPGKSISASLLYTAGPTLFDLAT